MELLPLYSKYLAILVFIGFLIHISINDIRFFTITNKTNLALMICFFVFAFLMGLKNNIIVSHVLIGIIAFIIGFILFYFGVWGGGDAKLLGVLGLWIGVVPIVNFTYYTALFGGLLALILLISRKIVKKTGLPSKPKWLRQILRNTNAIPYGVALSLGAIFVIHKIDWM